MAGGFSAGIIFLLILLRKSSGRRFGAVSIATHAPHSPRPGRAGGPVADPESDPAAARTGRPRRRTGASRNIGWRIRGRSLLRTHRATTPCFVSTKTIGGCHQAPREADLLGLISLKRAIVCAAVRRGGELQ